MIGLSLEHLLPYFDAISGKGQQFGNGASSMLRYVVARNHLATSRRRRRRFSHLSGCARDLVQCMCVFACVGNVSRHALVFVL